MVIKKNGLTQERLKDLLSYDKSTGVFTRLSSCGGRVKGSTAGFISKQGYLVIKIDSLSYYAQRLVWLYVYGYLPENDIDHIDRDKSNNKISNLREATRQCNLRNASIKSNNITGVIGVNWHKASKGWTAQVSLNYKKIYLGSYKDFNDAVKARWKAEVEYGFPTCNTTSSAYEYLKEHGILPK